MSASQSEDAARAVGMAGGEFGSKVQPTGPQQTTGHQPGILATKAEQAPESNSKVLPPGTAPASKTFTPNPDPTDPNVVGARASADPALAEREAGTGAQDSLPGATSADVHAGLGHPGAGMSSAELRHDGQPGRKREGGGLQKVGAKEVTSEDQYGSNRVDNTSSVKGASKKGESEAVARDEDRDM